MGQSQKVNGIVWIFPWLVLLNLSFRLDIIKWHVSMKKKLSKFMLSSQQNHVKLTWICWLDNINLLNFFFIETCHCQYHVRFYFMFMSNFCLPGYLGNSYMLDDRYSHRPKKFSHGCMTSAVKCAVVGEVTKSHFCALKI